MSADSTCRRCGVRPGTERWYVPNPLVSLAGVQVKFSAKRTVGCDECWAEFASSAPEAVR